MYISVIFRNRPVSDSIRSYAEQKLRQIVRQAAYQPIGMKIAFSNEGTQESVQVILNSGKALSSVMSATAGSVFEAIDELASRLRNHLQRRKERHLKRSIRMDRRRRRWITNSVEEAPFAYTNSSAEC